MKIMHIVGNRPQFIKLALLNKELEKRAGPALILHTGQHFDENMSAVFFDDLDIPTPHYSLGINQMSHNVLIGNMLIGIDRVLAEEKPELVVIYGDTNTSLAGALASKKRNIRLAHVEAGVRTGNEFMPEEANRYLSDRVSDLNFCCTWLGLENLEKEGLTNAHGHRAFNTGDLMLDATRSFAQIARDRQPDLAGLNTEQPFILATIHREENSGNRVHLENIIGALNFLHQKTPVLMPLHPRTKSLIRDYQLPVEFITCDALGYLDMLLLLQKCRSVITDSGGLSREAFFQCKPTLVLMEYPFWPELFLHGPCKKAAAEMRDIIQKQDELLAADKPFKVDIFGDGRAAEKISDALLANG